MGMAQLGVIGLAREQCSIRSQVLRVLILDLARKALAHFRICSSFELGVTY